MADDFDSFFPPAPAADGAPLADADAIAGDEEGGAVSERDTFARLSMTGKQSQERLERKKEEIYKRECPFRPQINPMPGDVHRPEDVFTNLYVQAKSREQKREKLRETVEQKKESENVFHPTVNKNLSREKRDQSLACDQLYQHALKQMKDKTKYSQDITRLDEECSFTPLLNPHSMKMAKKRPATSTNLCPSPDDVIEIRAEREQIQRTLELDGCTFTPQTNKSSQKRNPKQTFESLYQSSKQTQKKLEQMRLEKAKQEQSQCTHRPTVSKGSKQMGSQNRDVYSRLSVVKTAPSEAKHYDDDNLTFKPKTLSKGRSFGTERLYRKGVEAIQKRRDPKYNQVEKMKQEEGLKLRA